jgi:predicted PurR-regulated permease PerM
MFIIVTLLTVMLGFYVVKFNILLDKLSNVTKSIDDLIENNPYSNLTEHLQDISTKLKK